VAVLAKQEGADETRRNEARSGERGGLTMGISIVSRNDDRGLESGSGLVRAEMESGRVADRGIAMGARDTARAKRGGHVRRKHLADGAPPWRVVREREA
jgi:hypothetical protein